MAGRRTLIAALAALLAVPAVASDRPLSIDQMPAVSALQLAINQLSARPELPPAGDPTIGDEPPSMEMLVVRIKDGKPVIACVSSKEAAQRFLKAPVEKIGTTRIAEEQ